MFQFLKKMRYVREREKKIDHDLSYVLKRLLAKIFLVRPMEERKTRKGSIQGCCPKEVIRERGKGNMLVFYLEYLSPVTFQFSGTSNIAKLEVATLP